MRKSLELPGYGTFLADLKQRILDARASVARAVSGGLVFLYWDIGRDIVEKQRTAGWGDGVVERLSADLRAAFPAMRGFSAVNLWRMRQLYMEYSSEESLAQVVPELRETNAQLLSLGVDGAISDTGVVSQMPVSCISGKAVAEASPDPSRRNRQILAQAVRELAAAVPWGHHVDLLQKIKDPAARFYYLRATAQLGWSRNILLNQIKAGAYERAVSEKKTHNFEMALPHHLAAQADEMLRSHYNLEFLGLNRAMKERDLEDRLISHLQRFLLELGYGFCFVGRQYRLVLGSKDYFVDLLFYHRFLKALVAFDLKIGPFEPEHAGKMDFYLNLLNDKERGPGDHPSIGIILCAQKDDVEVEYALKTKANPIGVAEYRLQPRLPAEFKGRLPTARQLADAVRGALP